jgi:hypothetical protein
VVVGLRFRQMRVGRRRRGPCLRRWRGGDSVNKCRVELCRNVLNMLFVWVSAHSLSRFTFAEFLNSCSFVSSD